jgi:hypothetical protein
VERVDRIALLSIAGSVLLLTGMSMQVSGNPNALASVCRTRPNEVAGTRISTPSKPDVTRLATTGAAP